MKHKRSSMACGIYPVRLSMGTFVIILTGTLLSMVITLCFCLNCVSPSGKPVDWFIIYKVPTSTREMPIKTTGKEFYYLDALRPDFSYFNVSIQERQNNPLFNTLQQIYDRKAKIYAMYNDNPPKRHSGNTKLNHQTHLRWMANGAHMKGAYGFDEKDGFWLISSVPKFPAPRKHGYNYEKGQLLFAQSVLCVTLDKKYLTEMGKIFNLTKPIFYDANGPLTENQETDHRILETSTVVPFVSRGGQRFLLFAKSAAFRKDLYDSLVAVKLEDKLLVETFWPHLKSNCSTRYKVYNVKRVEFVHDEYVYTFYSKRDHAKWAVAMKKSWTCIGDINRNQSQLKRGGGTMCLYHEDLSKTFRKLVRDFEEC